MFYQSHRGKFTIDCCCRSTYYILFVKNNEFLTKFEKLRRNNDVRQRGKFVPGLNALILHAKSQLQADLIMFVSAEVQLSCETVRTLCKHVTENENVIVAGAAMNGHEYSVDESAAGKPQNRRVVPLTGRTTPWNTMCVWDLDKLSLTGFSLVSDLGKSAGVEECVAIALLQKLYPKSEARLVKIDGIEWEETFQDEERQKWHDQKMKSKVERPKIQLELLGLSGSVVHC